MPLPNAEDFLRNHYEKMKLQERVSKFFIKVLDLNNNRKRFSGLGVTHFISSDCPI